MNRGQASSGPLKPCPLCDSNHSSEFERLDWRGYPLVYRMCRRCGLVYQETRLEGVDQLSFYSEEYRQIYIGTEKPTARDIIIQKGRSEALCEILREAGIKSLGRCLDIGSSVGAWLQSLRRDFHCQAIGIEPSVAHRQYAREQGCTVYSSIDGLRESEDQRFDLISLLHVLEHLPDPFGMLKTLCANWLSPDGWLLVEVPNLYIHDSYELAHLACYTPHTLREMIRSVGFEVQAIKPHGRPRSNLLPLYLTLLARPVKGGDSNYPIRPERLVRMKRRAGMLYRRAIQKLFPHQAWLPLPGNEGGV